MSSPLKRTYDAESSDAESVSPAKCARVDHPKEWMFYVSDVSTDMFTADLIVYKDEDLSVEETSIMERLPFHAHFHKDEWPRTREEYVKDVEKQIKKRGQQFGTEEERASAIEKAVEDMEIADHFFISTRYPETTCDKLGDFEPQRPDDKHMDYNMDRYGFFFDLRTITPCHESKESCYGSYDVPVELPALKDCTGIHIYHHFE